MDLSSNISTGHFALHLHNYVTLAHHVINTSPAFQVMGGDVVATSQEVSGNPHFVLQGG
jgi:hypothetical protein